MLHDDAEDDLPEQELNGLAQQAGRGSEWPVTSKTAMQKGREEALKYFCEAYHEPIRHYLSRGRDEEEAKDLSQEFFKRLLERDKLGGWKPELGRLRTFVLAMLKQFVIERYRFHQAKKRGRGATHEEMTDETAPVGSSESLDYDLGVAMQVKRQVEAALMAECGNNEEKQGIQNILLSAVYTKIPSAELGEQLGREANRARADLSRLRDRFRELLREEVKRLVGDDPQEQEEELRWIARAWAVMAERDQ